MDELEAEGGVAARYARYRENQKLLAEGMADLGFQALLPPELQSPIITSFLYPDPKFDFDVFYSRVKARGFVLYPGKYHRPTRSVSGISAKYILMIFGDCLM